MNPHFSLSLTCLGGYSTLQALVYLSGFHPQQKLDFKLTYCTQESEDEKNLHGELRFHQSRLSGHTVDCPNLEPCDLDHSGWRRNTGGRRKRQRSYKNLQTIFSRSDLSRYVGVPRIWLWWRWRGRPRQGPWCFLCNTKTFPSHQMYLLTPSLLPLWHGFSLLSSSSPDCDFKPASLSSSAFPVSLPSLQALRTLIYKLHCQYHFDFSPPFCAEEPVVLTEVSGKIRTQNEFFRFPVDKIELYLRPGLLANSIGYEILSLFYDWETNQHSVPPS